MSRFPREAYGGYESGVDDYERRGGWEGWLGGGRRAYGQEVGLFEQSRHGYGYWVSPRPGSMFSMEHRRLSPISVTEILVCEGSNPVRDENLWYTQSRASLPDWSQRQPRRRRRQCFHPRRHSQPRDYQDRYGEYSPPRRGRRRRGHSHGHSRMPASLPPRDQRCETLPSSPSTSPRSGQSSVSSSEDSASAAVYSPAMWPRPQNVAAQLADQERSLRACERRLRKLEGDAVGGWRDREGVSSGGEEVGRGEEDREWGNAEPRRTIEYDEERLRDDDDDNNNDGDGDGERGSRESW